MDDISNQTARVMTLDEDLLIEEQRGERERDKENFGAKFL